MRGGENQIKRGGGKYGGALEMRLEALSVILFEQNRLPDECGTAGTKGNKGSREKEDVSSVSLVAEVQRLFSVLTSCARTGNDVTLVWAQKYPGGSYL